MFANEYNRKDIFIKPIEMQVKVDRTLSTIYPEINNEMWLNAGYASIPTIQYMIRELRIQNDLDTHHE
jgi:glutathionyl-hydroquinone reductase